MKALQRILFATDFSRASRAAWKEARKLAASPRTELLVAHVLPRLAAMTPQGLPLPRTSDEIAAAARRDAEASLAKLLEEARRPRLRVNGLLLTGRPEKAIARAARKHRVDLVVVGTRGRTGLPRFLLGSVAARIIAESPCPVLAVPDAGRP
jgi:nucleotide-binding universal stress UspA family protein